MAKREKHMVAFTEKQKQILEYLRNGSHSPLHLIQRSTILLSFGERRTERNTAAKWRATLDRRQTGIGSHRTRERPAVCDRRSRRRYRMLPDPASRPNSRLNKSLTSSRPLARNRNISASRFRIGRRLRWRVKW